MPIYEYRCQSCGYEFDKLQRMSDAPLIDCPSCGESSLKKLVSAAGFRLKGSGWYETDFKNNSKKADDKKGQDSKNVKSPNGESDTKTAETSTKAKTEDNKKESKTV
ncbi:MAG: zinc ribbon domain-containing protein [Pseudomonadota bacterium]|jgi:putative FmdB family regulatory protein|nr:FmdB family transcriptional regulator [Porticoccaceae bacterium]MCH2560164.1 zinc ribbon domain-containing protein [Pseudomonadales bacterium]MEC7390031.1 zinc ribbon domain-containing protein [Pseudomonadota bacterium]MAL68172.1 FmdB family transcriptional regulator [Porticoccaceae bacterium]MDP7403990.1 zinc ribbon domain-containing protein [Porticoccaceae bacterium]|tara:strand:- start:1389 stop:1709 length:321 start_codon:yes stop_codon:yes gene_type:complete